MARLIAYYGGTRLQRNRTVFGGFVQGPADFLYLVNNRQRRRQLESAYLEHRPQCLGPPVRTLSELIGSLAQDFGLGPPLPETARVLLLEELLNDGPGGKPLGPARLRAISWILARLKQQNILEPELLALAGGEAPAGLSRDELEFCFSRYQARLAELGVEDRWGQQALVYRGLLTGALSLRARFGEIRCLVVEGFSELTPVEHSILRQLQGEVSEVVVSTDLGPPPPDTGESSLFAEMRSFLSRAEWRPLQEPGSSPRPRVYRLATPEDECAWVAEHVATWSEGIPRTVGILSSRPDAYRLELRSALARQGIELAEVGGVRAPAEGPLDLLQDYLDLVLDNFPRRRLFDFLDHPRLFTGLDAAALDGIEKWAEVCRVREGPHDWSVDFPARVLELLGTLADDSPLRFPGEGAALARFGELISRLNLETEPCSFREWLIRLGKRLVPLLRPLPGQDPVTIRAENLSLRRLLRDIELLDGQTLDPVDLRQFAQCVQVAGDSKVADQGPCPSLCCLATPAEVDQVEFDVLIWMGLTDREFAPSFPNSAPSGDPGPDRSSSDWEAEVAARRSTFGWMIGQAADRVICTLPERVFGTPALVSPLLRGLSIEEERRPPRRDALDPALRENLHRGRQAFFERENCRPSPYNGFLVSSESLHTVWGKLKVEDEARVSPSLLEEYVRCGFRFLTERCLDVAEVSPPEPEQERRELGRIVHHVVHRFMAELPPPEGPASGDWHEKAKSRLRALLETELESRPLRKEAGLARRVQEDFLRAGLGPGDGRHGILSDFVLHQSRWLRAHHPEALEKRLERLELGQVELLSGPMKVVLEGTVDRVDRGPGGLVVIDYKTGQPPLGRLYQGWGFQLPLYVLLVRNHYQKHVEDAFFFQLQPPFEAGPRTIHVAGDDGQRWSRLADFYSDLALQAAQAMLSGKFPVTQLGAALAGCRECHLRDVCRMDSAQVERLRGSGHLPVVRPVLSGGQWVGPLGNGRKSVDGD